MKKGLFFVIEGIKESGTAKQTRLLYSYLKNLPNHYNLFMTHEPMRNKKIKTKKGREELSIYNKRHQRKIIKNLDIGGITLCKRYKLSNYVKQKYNKIEEIPDKEIKRINPDLTLFLDVDLNTIKKNIPQKKRLLKKFEKNKMFIQDKINRYKNLVQIAEENVNFIGKIKTINGNQPFMKVAKDIQEEFNSAYSKWSEN